MAGAGRVSVGGRELHCQHCAHAEFYHRTASLDRMALGGLFHLEGIWGQHTDIYVCARCGFSHFFMPVPEQPPERREAPKPRWRKPAVRRQDDVEPVEAEPHSSGPVPEEACLSCGKLIPPDATKCPACGWTWSDEGGEG